MFKIYYVENKINGKMYVGQTTMPIDKRWYYHTRDSSHCAILKNAIKKYGIDNFEINVFKYCNSQEEADQEEIYWIDQLSPAYNIKSGGSRGKHSEETKKKIGLAGIGNKYALGNSANKTSFKTGHAAPATAFKQGQKPWNTGTTYTRFSSDQINEMKQMHQSGLSNKDIMLKFHICNSTVRKLLSWKEN